MSFSEPQNPDPNQENLPGSGMVDSTGAPIEEAAPGELVADVPTTDVPAEPVASPTVTNPGEWTVKANGKYAGDQQALVDAALNFFAGYGTEKATVILDTGEEIDVSNPNV